MQSYVSASGYYHNRYPPSVTVDEACS